MELGNVLVLLKGYKAENYGIIYHKIYHSLRKYRYLRIIAVYIIICLSWENGCVLKCLNNSKNYTLTVFTREAQSRIRVDSGLP